MVEVWDCRRKEKMVTRKVGGDYELKFIDPATGLDKYVIWFQLKHSDIQSIRKVEGTLEAFKKLLERQE